MVTLCWPIRIPVPTLPVTPRRSLCTPDGKLLFPFLLIAPDVRCYTYTRSGVQQPTFETAGTAATKCRLPRKRGRADCSARSLSATRQEIIHVAYKHFRLLVCTTNAWPADDETDDLIIEAWQVACEELGWDLEDTSLRPTEQERRLIGDRECQ
ncbi:hypothetical protein OBBRIDRAFT_808143, partial [Obba rivulosa]